ALLKKGYLLWDSSWNDESWNQVRKTYFYDLVTQAKIELNASAGSALSQVDGLKLIWSASDGNHDQIYFYQNGQVHPLSHTVDSDNREVVLVEIAIVWIEVPYNYSTGPRFSYVHMATCDEG